MAPRIKPAPMRGTRKQRIQGVSGNDLDNASAVFIELDVPSPSLESAQAHALDSEKPNSSEYLFSRSELAGIDGSADGFDEVSYLRLNPDVRRAIDDGLIASAYLHYYWHGKAEGRAVCSTAQDVRNVSSSPAYSPLNENIFSRGGSCSVDELIVAPAVGLMIAGWIDDLSDPLITIRIASSNWRVALDATQFVRMRRGDVEDLRDGRAHAFGFIGFVHFKDVGEAAAPVRVELCRASGKSTHLQCGPTLAGAAELRDRVLATLASASFFGSSSIESMKYLSNGIGPELVLFNKSITQRIVARPYVERFGIPARAPRGSIIVCLYGKPEFFFLQNCLYGGLPGIEDYEFVYVSNSPEMAETLLREAHCASRIYGLTLTVVILPGNAGFGAANNVGSLIARSDRLLVVNPDVFPRDREWAKKHTELIEAVPTEQSRLFGVPLYYDDGSLMHGGMYFEVDVGLSISAERATPVRICRTQHYGKGAPANSLQFNRPRPVPAVTGAFMSIDRSWYEQLGGFTEDYIFGHYEDADLCLKSLGRGVAPWIQDIRLWHLEGKGSTWDPPHDGGAIVNRWLFSTTWMGTIEAGLLGPAPSHPLMQSCVAAMPITSAKLRTVRQKARIG